MSQHSSLLGVGIYSIAEASRLTGVSPWRINRWLSGYSFKVRGGALHSSRPVWEGDIPRIDGGKALSFHDLIEIRFINVFLNHGVSWKTLRAAEKKGRQLFNTSHPFSTSRFKTDGRDIFAEIYEKDRDSSLLELLKDQHVFATILSPFFKDIVFSDDDNPAQWWPLAGSKSVVIDPLRAFGQPIVFAEGVPTRILSSALATLGSERAVSKWYEVALESVRDAVRFEGRLMAA